MNGQSSIQHKLVFKSVDATAIQEILNPFAVILLPFSVFGIPRIVHRDVIDIYHTRFQIEFGFRDAKQFAGLENSQARSGNKLNFHFNAALTTVNIAKVMQLSNPQTRENSFSMATYKTLFHNNLMLSRFFRLFAINPNSIKNRQHVNELLYFGTMAA